jgi:hypothetical protein
MGLDPLFTMRSLRRAVATDGDRVGPFVRLPNRLDLLLIATGATTGLHEGSILLW